MGNIIDDVKDLIKLSDDELNEILLQEKYNKANLRELIRRTIKEVRDYKQAFEYQRQQNKKMEERLEKLKDSLDN